jgi:hypothetical protein
MTAGLAPGFVLTGGYVLRVTALDPTDGSVVTDVVVSDVSLQVDSDELPGRAVPLLPPLLAHEPLPT